MRLPKPRFFGNHTHSMHRSASSFIWLALVVVCGCGGTAPGTRAQPIPEPAFRWHFVGLPQLNASTNAAKLRQILALPATAKLQQEILTRSAGPLAELLMLETPSTPATTLAMQSLLPDLLQTESLIEVRVAGEMLKEWLVAVNLPDAAAADWEAKFKQLLKHFAGCVMFMKSDRILQSSRQARSFMSSIRPSRVPSGRATVS